MCVMYENPTGPPDIICVEHMIDYVTRHETNITIIKMSNIYFEK